MHGKKVPEKDAFTDVCEKKFGTVECYLWET